MGQEASLVRPRLARGCRCFAVVIDGAIAGYGWLSSASEWIGELQLNIFPRAGEGYIWNCATIAEHRRKGIFRAILGGITGVARSEGYRRLWIGSVDIPAEKAVRPSGFRPALTFRTASLLGMHLMVARRAPDADFSLTEEARHVLGSPGAPLVMGVLISPHKTKTH